MNIVLLSGGSGKRLWPISNDVRAKQFLKLFPHDDQEPESLIQRIYRQIEEAEPGSHITVATVEQQVSVLQSQVPYVDTCVEPARKNTFPAIVLAAAFLYEKRNLKLSDTIVVCPADMYVDNSFFTRISEMSELAKAEPEVLFLLGIKPDYPSEKYGYIIPQTDQELSDVRTFKEKPDQETAKQYIEQGALWNCGVFAFSLAYLKKIAEQQIGFFHYDQLLREYHTFDTISFDYAVVEKAERIRVSKYHGPWIDLGTWDTLLTKVDAETIGPARLHACTNTVVINETVLPVVALGMENTVVAASPDGILVCNLNRAASLKDAVAGLEQRPMQEERKWGSYKVLYSDADGQSLTKELIIRAGKNISYQKHHCRAEIWTIVSGEGLIILNGKVIPVKRGDSVDIAPEDMHAVKAVTDLHIIEVQVGNPLVEEDIERYEWPL